jgi:hypothetical protein
MSKHEKILNKLNQRSIYFTFHSSLSFLYKKRRNTSFFIQFIYVVVVIYHFFECFYMLTKCWFFSVFLKVRMHRLFATLHTLIM